MGIKSWEPSPGRLLMLALPTRPTYSECWHLHADNPQCHSRAAISVIILCHRREEIIHNQDVHLNPKFPHIIIIIKFLFFDFVLLLLLLFYIYFSFHPPPLFFFEDPIGFPPFCSSYALLPSFSCCSSPSSSSFFLFSPFF